jgi:ElaB/YqjD/DUF883 family membrane-anchored ribosome-binding protein
VSDINNTSNLRDDARKDPATLEREIDQTRANMDRTLGALERKFSPGQLLDQAMEFARENGGEFANNLGRSVKENPVPALLTAVGIAWMAASSNRPKSWKADAYDDRYTRNDFNAVEFDDTGYEDDAGDEKEGLTEKAQRLKASAEGTLTEAGQRVKSAAERTRQKLSGTKETMSARLRRTSGTAQAQTQRVREGFNSLLSEKPDEPASLVRTCEARFVGGVRWIFARRNVTQHGRKMDPHAGEKANFSGSKDVSR